MTSIVLIIPYFGQFPPVFSLWIQSVRYNSTIDFLLLTDNNAPYDYPVNVNVIKMSFEECQKLVRSKYDFQLSLNNPYKLCDFKPAYGYIFSDYIEKYDFWGYCDVDLIFGNIRNFVTEDLLSSYDRLFFHGHFALTRNTKICNRRYEERIEGCDYYQEVFQDGKNRYFDEYIMGHSSTKIWEIIDNDRCYKEEPYDDIFAPLWKGNNIHFYTTRFPKMFDCLVFKFFKGTLSRIYLKSGKQVEEETMYVHLQKRYIKIPSIVDCYILVPNRVIPEMRSISMVKQICYGRKRVFYGWYGNCYHVLQLMWHIFKRTKKI